MYPFGLSVPCIGDERLGDEIRWALLPVFARNADGQECPSYTKPKVRSLKVSAFNTCRTESLGDFRYKFRATGLAPQRLTNVEARSIRFADSG